MIAQDEASSVVWGMPGFVAKAGLAEKVVPLSEMVQNISRIIAETGGAGSAMGNPKNATSAA